MKTNRLEPELLLENPHPDMSKMSKHVFVFACLILFPLERRLRFPPKTSTLMTVFTDPRLVLVQVYLCAKIQNQVTTNQGRHRDIL